jgi:membrane-bound lytic murein transglycosylase B
MHKAFSLCYLPFSESYSVFISTFILIVSLFASPQIFATENINSGESFSIWQQKFKQLALKEGVTEKTFDLAFNQLTLNKKVLKLDNHQPEFSWSVWKYIDNTTASKRIEKGKVIHKKHQILFSEVSKEYNIPAELIIAIWAMESDFGGNYGSMNVIRSLATLGYAGKRKQFAQTELLKALKILQTETMQVKEMIGSWAGAMGHPQFMPSSFQEYAVDFNFDGKRDLWHSLDDSFASIARYMQAKGWKTGEQWGVEVLLPNDFNWQQQAKFNLNNERLTVSEWILWGIKPASDTEFQDENQLAELFFPAGYLGPVFLVFDNFNVIKKYNLSLSYSLSVGLLASAIANKGKDETLLVGKWPRDDQSLSLDDKILLQTQLNEKGFNAGEVDGKIGKKTRGAIRAWQLKNSLAADGYMPLRLFEKIKQGVGK